MVDGILQRVFGMFEIDNINPAQVLLDEPPPCQASLKSDVDSDTEYTQLTHLICIFLFSERLHRVVLGPTYCKLSWPF